MRRALAACGLLLGGALLGSCLPPLEPPGLADNPAHDYDGDGYTEAQGDCDDATADVGPGAPEVCNGRDDDCDALVDLDDPDGDGVGMTTWYADADGDGHGDPTDTRAACAGGGGYVAAGDDCDDTDNAVHPGAAEVCNGHDDDCDRAVDDADAELDARPAYVDADGDGYGTGEPTDRCELVDGWAFEDGDCDDGAAAVNPGAVEVCNEGVDDDCDGLADDEDTPSDPPTWYVDEDGDGYGDLWSKGSPRCLGEEGEASVGEDCRDDDPAINPGATEICNDGLDDDCDGYADGADIDVEGLVRYADEDGDGYGQDARSRAQCSEQAGWVVSGGDCDDGDSAVSPAADEVCADGVDNDCDVSIDEGCAA